MAGEDATELPIFELPAVLLPGELLPLHIFEERYKRLIGHCLEVEEPFGVVFRDEEGSARNVGCTAEVNQVLQRYDDGRMDIVVAGGVPFRVLERTDGPEFPAGEVELIDLEAEPPERDAEAAEGARSAFSELAEQAGSEPPDPDRLRDQDSYALAARITLPPATKQELLRTRSEAERMRMLERALRAVSVAVRRSRKVAERARTNGNVRLRGPS
jgi:Lon protease-like protein